MQVNLFYSGKKPNIPTYLGSCSFSISLAIFKNESRVTIFNQKENFQQVGTYLHFDN